MLKNKNNDNQIEPINYNKEDVKNKLKDYPSYVNIYQGMGCICLFKRLNITSEIEYLFIHSDDHYIEDVNLKINNFVEGYTFIE